MATLKDETIASTYDLLVKRHETYVQTGTNIELMTDTDGATAPTGLYLESGATTDNVGIGVAAPTVLLHVVGTDHELKYDSEILQLHSDGASTDGVFEIDTIRDQYIRFRNSGNLKWSIWNHSVATSSHSLKITDADGDNGCFLTQDGGDTNTNAWANNSDERMKENLVEIEDAVDKLNSLRCVEFNFIHQGADKTRMGLIAQDVYKVYPYATIGTPDDDYQYIPKSEDSPAEHRNAMGLAYQELVTPLIKAVQELSAKVTALENA